MDDHVFVESPDLGAEIPESLEERRRQSPGCFHFVSGNAPALFMEKIDFVAFVVAVVV